MPQGKGRWRGTGVGREGCAPVLTTGHFDGLDLSVDFLRFSKANFGGNNNLVPFSCFQSDRKGANIAIDSVYQYPSNRVLVANDQLCIDCVACNGGAILFGFHPVKVKRSWIAGSFYGKCWRLR